MDFSSKCYKFLIGWVVSLQGHKAVHIGHQTKGEVFNEMEWMESQLKTNQVHINSPLLTFVWNCTNIYKQALQMEFYQVPNGHLHLVRNLVLCCYHIYSNKCAIIRYINILTCGNPATCFGHFQGGIQQKNTMASYVMCAVSCQRYKRVHCCHGNAAVGSLCTAAELQNISTC
jgi:hypothetical protein